MTMTQVDFYLINQSDARARQMVACKIAEKAYRARQGVYILVDAPRGANEIDELLWTFRPGSFIPHGIAVDSEESLPISIGTVCPKRRPAVLINLTAQIPDFFTQADRVIEIVTDDPPDRDAGRERYRQYRTHGITPLTHTLT